MKKSIFLPVLVCLLLVLAACGKTEEKNDYYDIQAESRFLESAGENQFLLGLQYYQGEPVSLLGETVRAEGAEPVIDVYLIPAGKERQLFLSGVSNEYRFFGWYLDQEGRCFIQDRDSVVRLDADGNMLYRSRSEDRLKDICQLENGRMILLTERGGIQGLAEIDPDTGVITKLENVSLGNGTGYIGASGDRLMFLDEEGFWRVDLKNGTKEPELSVAGTSYSFLNGAVKDFWVDGSEAGVLWDSAVEEHLALVNIGAEREIIVVRGWFIDSWLKEQVTLFNKQNGTYYAVIEEGGESVSWEDFLTETNLQLVAGKGADIISKNAIHGDIYSLIDKGVFADLKPFMEASGMSEEDYFPAAFDIWRYDGKIYGAGTKILMWDYTVDRSILKSGEELTVETLADAMLGLEEERFFYQKYSAGDILNFFLQGSEDLWGMIDWEKGTCDFKGELFSKMLLAAQKCAYDGKHDYQDIMEQRAYAYFYNHESDSDLEKRNRMPGGVFFDDGCHAEMAANYVFGINAKSRNPEGAWELLTFLLGEEAQLAQVGVDGYMPINRAAFDKAAQQQIDEGAIVHYVDEAGRSTIIHRDALTQEKVGEIMSYLEEARALPIRTVPLLAIIQEEAKAYFTGEKSMDEVIGLIENRVGLYLQEQKK